MLERQVAVADDAAKKTAILVKLGILYTEKVQDAPGRATAAWQALLAAEPENRRAQDALKKLYLQQKDWNALEGFYAAQGKVGRAGARPRAAGRDRRTTPRASACGTRSASSIATA